MLFFAASDLSKKYPAGGSTSENAWDLDAVKVGNRLVRMRRADLEALLHSVRTPYPPPPARELAVQSSDRRLVSTVSRRGQHLSAGGADSVPRCSPWQPRNPSPTSRRRGHAPYRCAHGTKACTSRSKRVQNSPPKGQARVNDLDRDASAVGIPSSWLGLTRRAPSFRAQDSEDATRRAGSGVRARVGVP